MEDMPTASPMAAIVQRMNLRMLTASSPWGQMEFSSRGGGSLLPYPRTDPDVRFFHPAAEERARPYQARPAGPPGLADSATADRLGEASISLLPALCRGQPS